MNTMPMVDPCSERSGRKYIVTARGLGRVRHILPALFARFHTYGFDRVRTVFGFTEDFSPLYGGRSFDADNAIPYAQLDKLRAHGIHFDLAVTNHFFTEEAYAQTRPILDRIDQPGNGVICTNDELARRVARDYPGLNRRLSSIRELDTREEVEEALALYDFVTLHADMNDRAEFLQSLPEKHRIILFANATCGYHCALRTCYLGFSQGMFGQPVTSTCSHSGQLGDPVRFPIVEPQYDGFEWFKLIWRPGLAV